MTAAQPQPGARVPDAAETATEGHAADWQARLMEAILHEQLQGREPSEIAPPTVDVTDEGWLPT